MYSVIYIFSVVQIMILRVGFAVCRAPLEEIMETYAALLNNKTPAVGNTSGEDQAVAADSLACAFGRAPMNVAHWHMQVLALAHPPP